MARDEHLVRAVVIVLHVAGASLASTSPSTGWSCWRSRTARAEVRPARRPLLAAGDHGCARPGGRTRGSHLAGFILTGVETLVQRSCAAGRRPADDGRRAGAAARSSARTRSCRGDLNKGLNILASTGSTAPFVGLLGTVLGIFERLQAGRAAGLGRHRHHRRRHRRGAGGHRLRPDGRDPVGALLQLARGARWPNYEAGPQPTPGASWSTTLEASAAAAAGATSQLPSGYARPSRVETRSAWPTTA